MQWRRLALVGLMMMLLGGGRLSAAGVTGEVAGVDKEELPFLVVWVEGRDLANHLKPPTTHAVNDQRDMTFIPHVLPIVVGTTVDFLNNDKIFHTVYSYSEAKRFNFPIMAGMKRELLFDKPGMVELHCAVHHEMQGHIVVLATPFFTSVGKDGTFTLDNLPPGKHTLVVWHERRGIKRQEITVPESGSATTRVYFEEVTTK